MGEGKTEFLNIQYDNVKMEEALDFVCGCVEEKRKSYVVFLNSDVIVKSDRDSYLRKIINEAGMALIDGKPLLWISRFQKIRIKEKISGSDFIPLLCEKAKERRYRIFLLGGEAGIPDRAAENLKKKYPGIQIVGTDSPYMGFEKDPKEVERIREKLLEASPDILICSFGCPKQETFIYEHFKTYDATVSICAGATMDFLAGKIKRCPRWMSEWGLEWFYRFLKEPRRLFKRYFIDDMNIFRMAVRYWPGKKK